MKMAERWRSRTYCSLHYDSWGAREWEPERSLVRTRMNDPAARIIVHGCIVSCTAPSPSNRMKQHIHDMHDCLYL